MNREKYIWHFAKFFLGFKSIFCDEFNADLSVVKKQNVHIEFLGKIFFLLQKLVWYPKK